MHYSSGMMKEFAYLGLAQKLLESSKLVVEHGALPFEALIDDYHDNKRINRRIEKLQEQINAMVALAVFKNSPFFAKVQSLGLKMMSIAPAKVQGELLAVYVLWYRFQPHEREKPLHEIFKPLSEKDGELFGILELFEKHMDDDYISQMEELGRLIARLL